MKGHHWPAPWVSIVGYHRIVAMRPEDDYWHICTTRERFTSQMRWFARSGYRTLSLEQVADLIIRGERIPPRHFVITFDDGYQDTLTEAAPVLKHHGFTATMFVVTGLVGERNIWDEGKGNVAPLMTWEQVKQWVKLGFSVGAHSVSHPHLSQLTPEEVRHELIESRKTLESVLGTQIRTFCYPFGDWSDVVCSLVAEVGYDLACDDVGRKEHGRYSLARCNPAYWPPALTPLIRSQRWYFELYRRGLFDALHQPMSELRRLFASPVRDLRRMPAHESPLAPFEMNGPPIPAGEHQDGV